MNDIIKRLSLGGGGLFLDHEVLDSVVQLDDDLSLADAEAGGGRNVNDATNDGGVFATGASHGETHGLANLDGLGLSAILAEVGQLDVNGGAHTSAHVSGAGGDHTVFVRLGAATIDLLLDNIDSSLEAVEDLVEHGAGLHAHDAEMILLTEPDDESFVLRVVASATVGPVLGNTSSQKVLVGGHVLEHDVLLDERVVLLFVDEVGVVGGDRDVLATVILVSDQHIEHLLHLLLHFDAFILGHGAGEWELLQVAAGTDAHRNLLKAECGHVELAVLGEAIGTFEVPVSFVRIDAKVNLVVLAESLLEERLEIFVVVGVHGVAAHSGIWALNT